MAGKLQGALPVDQDLANLDTLAAGTQSILHGLSTSDDAHTTQLLCKSTPTYCEPVGVMTVRSANGR